MTFSKFPSCDLITLLFLLPTLESISRTLSPHLIVKGGKKGEDTNVLLGFKSRPIK
jgi:hypothetical protein